MDRVVIGQGLLLVFDFSAHNFSPATIHTYIHLRVALIKTKSNAEDL